MNKVNNPMISVIIPVYNVKNYLIQCVDSVINQSYKNLEIILVDDGSTDGSADICDELKLKDNRISVLHKINGGLSSARNAALDIATGDYISFIDSDDVIHTDMYTTLLDVIIKGYDIVECEATKFFDDDIIDLTTKITTSILTERNREKALNNIVKNPGMSVSFCNKLFSKDLFSNIRFKDGITHEDEHLIFRVYENINKMASISNPLYYYRTRQNSIMTSKNDLRRLNAIFVWEDRMIFCDKRNWLDLAQHTNATLYYECINLYKQNFFKENLESKQYIENTIEKYKKRFVKNKNIKIKHRFILCLGKLYRIIF